MTISTTAASIIVLGDGVTTQFQFPFVGVNASDISVVYTDATGTPALLPSTAYTITLNPAAVNQLWGIGGFITYINSGSPIAAGTSLTITRTLPLTQTISIANQGLFTPTVVEQMGDKLEMQIQQVAARTGQIRGTWATGVSYNFGDVVQDGANGANSKSYYMCAIANTSGTWAADVANGDWSLVIQSGIPAASLPLAIASGGTASTTTAAARTALGLAIGTNVQAWSANLDTWAGKTVPSGAVVGTTDIQSLSNKTITNSSVNNTSIGLSSSAAAAFTTLQSSGNTAFSIGINTFNVITTSGTIELFSTNGQIILTTSGSATVSITSAGLGALDGMTIGGVTPAAGIFTSLSANDNLTMTAANKGIVFKRGSNGRCGIFTVAGASTVNVSNTSVASTDVISISVNTVAGTSVGQARITAISPGSQFSVAAVSGDVSVYNYTIFSNAA